jgi:hypothetical protein
MSARSPARTGALGAVASIAAMPKLLRSILLAVLLAAICVAIAGCGGSNNPPPSIPGANALILRNKIAEIRANVDNGSCLVASAKTDDLIADIQDLPSTVNGKVVQALQNGANNLKLLLADPNQCQGRQTTTTTPSTTESTTESTTTTATKPTTTTRTQTQATTTQTQTQPNTTPGNPSGGVGPGGL